MPSLISASEFVEETKHDLSSPTSSKFLKMIPECRQTINSLEESLDFDRDGLSKMKKAVKGIQNSANAHVATELYLSNALKRLGANAMSKDSEVDIGTAYIKFSILTKELSDLMKNLFLNLNNIVMFPLDSLLKGDLKGVKGDLKKPFEKAYKEYESKLSKIEKEKKSVSKEAALSRGDIPSAEVADDTDRERKLMQYAMAEYLLKVNDIKTKKNVELLQHLIEYYHAQKKYFQDGLKALEDFDPYIRDLDGKLVGLKSQNDEERRQLNDLRNLLRVNAPFLESSSSNSSKAEGGSAMSSSSSASATGHQPGGYSLHQLQGNKHYGSSKSGYLMKKSEGKMRVKAWQKRKCEVAEDGYLYIYHSDESKVPTKVNLLTCHVKPLQDEKRCFDLISPSCRRTYHFQAEDDIDLDSWTSVIINCKEGALKREFDQNSAQMASSKEMTSPYNPTVSPGPNSYSGAAKNQSLCELQQSIIKQIQRLPGNDRCVDCNSTDDPSWLSTNFGVLTCIECCGVHRDLGVQISRTQSLKLDYIGTSQLLLARTMSNAGFNEIMEATMPPSEKPKPSSTMEQRRTFIRAKYKDRRFVVKSCSDESDLKAELESAVFSRDLYQVLQIFSEGADLTWVLPSFEETGDTALHVACAHDDGQLLHIVDFLVKNSKDLNKINKRGDTPLHICVRYNQPECMKLLLRSNVDIKIKNNLGKTPMDMAREQGSTLISELLEHAAAGKKNLFENVNFEWDLQMDELPSDYSDEELMDDKQYFMKHTPGPHVRSRPSSVVGSESPSSRARDSFRQKQNRKITSQIIPFTNLTPGSVKKKIAPLGQSVPRNGSNRSADEASGGGILSDPYRNKHDHNTDDEYFRELLGSQGKSLLEKGIRNNDANEMMKAEGLLLRAGRIELAVEMYKESNLWEQALKVCENHVPSMVDSVKRQMISSSTRRGRQLFENVNDDLSFASNDGSAQTAARYTNRDLLDRNYFEDSRNDSSFFDDARSIQDPQQLFMAAEQSGHRESIV